MTLPNDNSTELELFRAFSFAWDEAHKIGVKTGKFTAYNRRKKAAK